MAVVERPVSSAEWSPNLSMAGHVLSLRSKREDRINPGKLMEEFHGKESPSLGSAERHTMTWLGTTKCLILTDAEMWTGCAIRDWPVCLKIRAISNSWRLSFWYLHYRHVPLFVRPVRNSRTIKKTFCFARHSCLMLYKLRIITVLYVWIREEPCGTEYDMNEWICLSLMWPKLGRTFQGSWNSLAWSSPMIEVVT